MKNMQSTCPMQYATLNVINLEHTQCVTLQYEFAPWLKSGIRDSSVTGQVHISNINAYWVHILVCPGAYYILVCISGAYYIATLSVSLNCHHHPHYDKLLISCL